MEALRETIFNDTLDSDRNSCRDQQYQRSNMQRSAIMNKLRQAGCRITKQRKIILDIILQEECTCCKEIYFLAARKDPNIGMATIYRMINLLEEMGGCIKPPHLAEERPYFSVNRHEPDTAICPFDPEMYKIAADRLVEKYGIKVLFHTYITAAIMEGKTIRGVIIENKSGRQAVYAKRVIDCTGDGDVIAYTGAPFETGVGEKDGEEVKSPVSTMFCMDGLAPDTVTWKVDKSLAYGAVNLFPLMKEDEFRAEMTRVTGINPCSAEDITKGEIACRKQILEVLDWLHHNYKGTEHARLTKVANMMGMMVSRRIVAEYKVTRDDILNYTIFDDAISMNAYGVDIHNPNGGGCELYWLIPGHAYSIPYRALLPLEVENIIAAGRCIAHDGIAVMATCYGTGEAAGAAAALSIKEDVPFRKLSVKKLQDQLKKQGVYLGDQEPEKPEPRYIHISTI